MRKSRFIEEQIVEFIWQAEAGMLLRAFAARALQRRDVLAAMVEQFHLSERRACRLAGLARDSYRDPRQESQMNQALSAKIIESVLVCLRLGYRRIHDLLRPQFEDVNHKRMLRLPEMASSYGVEDAVLKQCLKSIERQATQLRSLPAEVLHGYAAWPLRSD